MNIGCLISCHKKFQRLKKAGTDYNRYAALAGGKNNAPFEKLLKLLLAGRS